MRIFTGAPLPEGADRVVIQEDVPTGRAMTSPSPRTGLTRAPRAPRGIDFEAGDQVSGTARLRPGRTSRSWRR